MTDEIPYNVVHSSDAPVVGSIKIGKFCKKIVRLFMNYEFL